MTLLVRAPATTANLGPGFDCAGAALDLWNELEVTPGDGERVVLEGEGADELPRSAEHLALRAFALVAPVEGHSLPLRQPHPARARARLVRRRRSPAGLVAGLAVAGREASPDEVLALGHAARGPRRQPRARRVRRCLPELAERHRR